MKIKDKKNLRRKKQIKRKILDREIKIEKFRFNKI